MPDRFPNLHLSDHPLVRHKLTLMRDRLCPTEKFRRLLKEIGMLMAYEATRDLPLAGKEITTPLDVAMTGDVIAGKKLVIVPILRAGIILADGIQEVIPGARVGHIGLKRDHDTFQP